jgi:anti-sigma regulatory factor (Ser/Thr protein kinase)
MISRIADASQVAEARRAAAALAREGGLDEVGGGRVALAATEMATNLLKHAGGGEIVMQRIADGDGDCLELLALDAGPGIANAAHALEDGYSTAGSAGTGLGAIRRQADHFALWSRPGLGAAVMARFTLGRAGAPSPGMAGVTLGAITEPFPGETVSGDGWAFRAAPAGPTLLVADGSGHGPAAAKAADAARAAFEKHQALDCVRLAEVIHGALKPTRGGAIAIARIDTPRRLVRFIGIGNIAGALSSDGACRRMVSHNGIAGHVAAHFREFTYSYAGAPTVILHSDGLSTKWNLGAYPGLATSHPSLIAGVLFRTQRRLRDDACIVVMRTAA